MYAISPKKIEMSPEYLQQLLLSTSFTRFAVDASMRVAMPKVNREALADCPMWFPSAVEQVQVLSLIARESKPFDTAVSRLKREIELLREYRTRLIADVVTGKLDVREAAARLPEEVVPDMDEETADSIDDTDLTDDEVAA